MGGANQEVLLIEPWFAKFGHVQFNRAFLAVLRAAFPAARITFACSAQYRRDLEDATDGEFRVADWIEADAWLHPHNDVGEFLRRTRWLLNVLGRLRDKGIRPTHLVILGSSGTLLPAAFVARVLRLPRTSKAYAVLHGGEEILHGWQPRNPVLRLLTFRTAIKLLSATGVRVIAAEMFIAEKLRKCFPKQAKAILCIPMAYDATESLPPSPARSNGAPFRILFLGQATIHKGFAEFVRLAQLARASCNAPMEFRAAGALRQDVRHIDQSPLAKPAVDHPLARSELLAELALADLVFTWQSDYYEISSSGTLLDCIGLGVPMVGRRGQAIADIEARHGPCGLFANDIESLFSALIQLVEPANRSRQISAWKDNLRNVRNDRSAEVLGVVARRELGY